MKKKFLLWIGITLAAVVIISIGFVFSVDFLYEKNIAYDKAFTLGERYFEQKQYEKAIENYRQALSSKRWEIDAETAIMKIYHVLGQSEMEIEFLKERLKEAPDEVLFDGLRLYRIGEIYHRRLKDFTNAKVYYLKAIEKLKDPSSYNALAEMCEQEGDAQQAINFREEGLKQMTLIDSEELAKNKAKRLSELGNLYVKVNRIDDAKNAFQEAIKLDSQNLIAQEALKKLSS